jgi:hypothetical protein
MVRVPLGEAVHGTKPNQVLHMDFIDMKKLKHPFYKALLVIRDDLSSYVGLTPTEKQDKRECANALLKWFSQYGVPEVLCSDNGGSFDAEVIREINKHLGIKQHLTVAYGHQGAGTVERVNKTALTAFRAILGDAGAKTSEWPDATNTVQHSMNHADNSMYKKAPIELFMGRAGDKPIDFMLRKQGRKLPLKKVNKATVETNLKEFKRELEQLRSTAVEQINKKRDASRRYKNSGTKQAMPSYDQGETVWVSMFESDQGLQRNKAQNVWIGPMLIADKVNEYVYTVADLFRVKRTVHVNRLKIYGDGTLPDMDDSDAVKRMIGGIEYNSQIYHFKEILTHNVTERGDFWLLAQQMNDDEAKPMLLQAMYRKMATMTRDYINNLNDGEDKKRMLEIIDEYASNFIDLHKRTRLEDSERV